MDDPLQIDSRLRQLLKSLCKSRQMTQAQLAQRLGVVQSRVADTEREVDERRARRRLPAHAQRRASFVYGPS